MNGLRPAERLALPKYTMCPRVVNIEHSHVGVEHADNYKNTFISLFSCPLQALEVIISLIRDSPLELNLIKRVTVMRLSISKYCCRQRNGSTDSKHVYEQKSVIMLHTLCTY